MHVFETTTPHVIQEHPNVFELLRNEKKCFHHKPVNKNVNTSSSCFYWAVDLQAEACKQGLDPIGTQNKLPNTLSYLQLVAHRICVWFIAQLASIHAIGIYPLKSILYWKPVGPRNTHQPHSFAHFVDVKMRL